MRLVWSVRARTDLLDIEAYSLGRWGRSVAREYLTAIDMAVDATHAAPLHQRLLQGAYRMRRAGSHMVIFHLDPAGGRLTVVRILHSAMDLERYLPRDAQTSEL